MEEEKKKIEKVVRFFCEERDKEIEHFGRDLESLSKHEKRRENLRGLQEFRNEFLEVL